MITLNSNLIGMYEHTEIEKKYNNKSLYITTIEDESDDDRLVDPKPPKKQIKSLIYKLVI